jgi:hypothetical protein
MLVRKRLKIQALPRKARLIIDGISSLLRSDRLDEAGVIVFDVADARAHRPSRSCPRQGRG